MAINPVSVTSQSGGYQGTSVTPKHVEVVADGTPTIAVGEAAVYEASEQTTKKDNTTYTSDTATLSEISQQVEAKLANLRATVEQLVARQGLKAGEAQGLSYDQILEKYDGKLKEFYQNLEVDEETRLKAQAEISEDGFWGVKQTAERVLNFAKAISGGDPSKIELLKSAIEAGYKAAEKSWGGQLPEICQQTQEAILKGLDDWAKEAGLTTTPAAEE